MSYVSRCKYDLFISYAHVDNEPAPDGSCWVFDFFNCLSRTTRQKLGREADDLQIFFDPKLQANQRLPQILEAASNSALFLAVGSPSWVTSDFCSKELAAFTKTAPDASRMFIAEYMPLGGDLGYPGSIDEHLRLEFHSSKGSIGHIRMPLDGSSPSDKALYLEKIHQLADQLAEKLREMRKSSSGTATKPSAPILLDDSDVPTVLIAEPTDDLEDWAASLGAYLAQFGVRPLFAPKNYLGVDEFQQQFQGMLDASDMFVQLLGPFAGKRPPTLPQGFTAYQAEEAERSGKPMMQWRRPDLDLDQVVEPHRTLLEGKDVVSSTFEEFKAGVKDKAIELKKAQPEPKAPRPPSSLVFIDADRTDRGIAEKIGREFQANGLFCMLPSTSESSEEFRRDLEENLVDCDVLVCLYGSTQSFWVDAQLRFLHKVNRKREVPLQVLAVCTGPPKPKQPIGSLYPGMREIDCGEDWSMEPIREFIGELKQ